MDKDGDKDSGAVTQNPHLDWATIKQTLKGWKIYVLTFWDVLFWASGLHVSGGTYLLWIKSLNRYGVTELDNLGSTAPAIGILYLFVFAFASDMFLGRPWALSLSYGWNMIGLVILVIWNVPESAKWFAYNTTYGATVVSPIFHGWANNILKHNTAERAFVLVTMNCIAQGMSAWIAVVVFPTVEAPRYTKGFSFTLAVSIVFLLVTQVVRHLHNRDEALLAAANAHINTNTPSVEHQPESSSIERRERTKQLLCPKSRRSNVLLLRCDGIR